MSMYYNNNVNNVNNNKEGNCTMKNPYLDNNLDVTNPAPRCPVVLLLDTSSSMSGAPINELNQALKQFIRETAEDEAAGRSVELEVITFDSKASVAMPFCGISDVEREPAPLIATGSTAMGAGLRLALKELKARRKLYKNTGISCYKPWVILMTDGAPNDDNWEIAAEEMRSMGTRREIQYLGIAIGNCADHALIKRIIPDVPGPKQLKGLHFKEFFLWLTDSLSNVSASAVSDEDHVQFGSIDDWAEYSI